MTATMTVARAEDLRRGDRFTTKGLGATLEVTFIRYATPGGLAYERKTMHVEVANVANGARGAMRVLADLEVEVVG